MAKEFATYDDQAIAPGQKSHGLRVVNDDLALSGRPKEDPLAELARIIGNTDHYRESLRQNNRIYEEPSFEPPMAYEPADDAPQPAASLPLRETRQEPAFSASEFQPPVFEEHRWPEVSAPQPVPAAKTELEWDDLEAELASISSRRQPAAPVRPAEASVPAPPPEDFWPEFNDTTRSTVTPDHAASYAENTVSYAPEPVYEQDPRRWDDETGQVHHALAGEREAEPYYTDQSHLPDPDSAFEEAAPPRSRRAGMMTVAVVLGVAALGGVGIAGYRAISGGATKSGEAKIVKADPAPMKVAAPAAVENAKRVQDRVPTGTEQVVSREEQPLTPREQAAQVQAPAQPVGPRVISLSAPRDDAAEANPFREDPAKTVAATPAPVPSVTPAAPVTAAPVPVAPVTPVTTTPVTVPSASAPVPRPASADEPRRVKTLAVGPDGNLRQPAQTAANAPVSLAPAAVAASRPAPATAAPQQVAAARPAAPPVASAPTAGGGFVVQITSQRSDADARAAFASVQRRQPVLAGMSPNIKAVDLGDRGTYYRVRVGPMSRDGANDLCQKLKSNGNDCIVQPN